MKTAAIRFYNNLNDFLPPEQQYVSFSHVFNGQPSVKDLIESLGVPHTEVDLLLVDGESAAWSRQVQGGERVAVYPRFFTLDIAGETQVRPAPLHDYRFIADVHLGK
ncbi:MAG: twitching motility protein PilT, partial [Bacillota bacterium]|nr:twitching motility protein PilT [Bacillota bacterium]